MSFNLERWADVRNTSKEVAEVIRDAARNRLDKDDLDLETAMQALWENPTDDERKLIEVGAFELADPETTVLHWGVERLHRPTA